MRGEEQPDQVFRSVADRQLAEGARLGLEAGGHAPLEADFNGFKCLERRGIVAVGFFQHRLARLAVDQLATRRRLLGEVDRCAKAEPHG